MVTVNENIRFYKPNDPYFYEVDNLPLIDLLENDKTLADAINDILLSQSNFATEGYVQLAVGDSNIIDINGDGDTANGSLPNNVIQWVLAQNYGQGSLESLTDTDVAGASDGDSLVYNVDAITGETKWIAAEPVLPQNSPVEYNDLESDLTGKVSVLKSMSSTTGSQKTWVDVTGTSYILSQQGTAHDPIRYAYFSVHSRGESDSNSYMYFRKGGVNGAAYVTAARIYGAGGNSYDTGGMSHIKIPVQDISDTEGPGKFKFQIYYSVGGFGSLMQIFHTSVFTQAV